MEGGSLDCRAAAGQGDSSSTTSAKLTGEPVAANRQTTSLVVRTLFGEHLEVTADKSASVGHANLALSAHVR
jgi:hypothetical protein